MSAPTTTRPETTRTYAAYSKPLWQRVLLTREFAIIALLVAVVLYANANIDNFAPNPGAPFNLTMYNLFRDIAPILLIALPMTLIIITGEIDLSVASTVGLTSVMVGILHVDVGLSIPVAGLLAILIGALCGAVNGFLIAYVGLPSLAVTIGTLALFRGIAVGLLGTEARTDFPQEWKDRVKDRIFESQPFPMIMIPIVVLIIAFALLLHFSSFGRGVYEIGLNDEAAHFTGVNVELTKFWLFVFAGAVSGLAGIYYTLNYGSARGENATGMELQVIAAVLLGGVSIFGGKGALHGVIAGVLLIGVLGSAMRLEGYTVNIIYIVTGVLLVLSVISPRLLSWASGLRSARGRGSRT